MCGLCGYATVAGGRRSFTTFRRWQEILHEEHGFTEITDLMRWLEEHKGVDQLA